MDNTLIFLLAVTFAGILFSAFSGMAKKSARYHREEEERMRKREARMRDARRLELENKHSQRTSSPGYLQLDEATLKWYNSTVSPDKSPQLQPTKPKSMIEEYEED